jgi:hypothetical protein
MSSTMFSKKMLYIPDYVVYEDIPKIIKYFEDFSIAKVKHVQVLPHSEPEYYVTDINNYSYALIEIDYYYYNQGSYNFYNAIKNNKCRMVYDDPHYWEVQFSPFKEDNTQTTINSQHYERNDNGDTNCYNSDEEYVSSSDVDDETKDPHYVYQDDSSSTDDDYNYESYKKNYNSFKSKQKAKRQKFNEELVKLKKTLETIKKNQEQMRALLISNKKFITKDSKKIIKKGANNDWTRRLRVKF